MLKVQIQVQSHCRPLSEDKFKHIIADNYSIITTSGLSLTMDNKPIVCAYGTRNFVGMAASPWTRNPQGSMIGQLQRNMAVME